jgi:hypothetical protein
LTLSSKISSLNDLPYYLRIDIAPNLHNESVRFGVAKRKKAGLTGGAFGSKKTGDNTLTDLSLLVCKDYGPLLDRPAAQEKAASFARLRSLE